MRRLRSEYKKLLEKIAKRVRDDASLAIKDPRIIPVTDLKPVASNTYGWYIVLFRFKDIGGRIELWMDLFANIGRPVLTICYSNRDLPRLNKIVESEIPDFKDDHEYKSAVWASDNNVLAKPLEKKYFERLIIEPYQRKFLSYYCKDNLGNGYRTPKSLISKVINKTTWLLRAAASGLEVESANLVPYPAIENRRLVSIHIRRERSKRLANQAKIRDGFVCRVCNFNFVDRYGELGRGFAEAHHILSLYQIKLAVNNTVDDLITVCSNCHRMLHRMDGRKSDYKTLRRKLNEFRS